MGQKYIAKQLRNIFTTMKSNWVEHFFRAKTGWQSKRSPKVAASAFMMNTQLCTYSQPSAALQLPKPDQKGEF